MLKNLHTSSCKVTVILVIFERKIEFSRKIFEKYSNIKFHENPSRGGPVVRCGRADGRTDKHDEAYSCFSQFSEHA